MIDLNKDLTCDLLFTKQEGEELKNQINLLKEDVDLLKGDVASIKSDINLIKNNIDSIEGDIDLIKDDIEKLKDIRIEGKLGDSNILQIKVCTDFGDDGTNIDLSKYVTQVQLENHINNKVNEDGGHEYNPNLQFKLKFYEDPQDLLIQGKITLDDVTKTSEDIWTKDCDCICDCEEIDFEYVFTDVTQQDNQFEFFTAVKINGIVKSDTTLINVDLAEQVENITNNYRTEIENTTNNHTNEIENITNEIENITNEIENITNNYTNEIENITNEIENITNNYRTEIENITNNYTNETEVNRIRINNTIEACCEEILSSLQEYFTADLYEIDCEATVPANRIKLTQSQSTGLAGIANLINQTNKDLNDIKYQLLCELNDSIEERTGTEVITIVASDREVSRIVGKQLILHFVTFDNYPKRQKNSTYRPIQIPEPIDEFNWEEHFENLLWIQGNLYCELSLKTIDDVVYKSPVSGYFQDKDVADMFFDKVLLLTKLVENNRRYHSFSEPKKDILIKQTRPYRAFITSIDENGKGVCETKYLPVL